MSEKSKQEVQRLQTDVAFAQREVQKWEKEFARVAAVLSDRRARHNELKIQLDAVIEEFVAANEH